MFKNLKALSSEQHRGLRLNPQQPFHYASSEVLIPLIAGEVAMAAREYVIVFGKGANSVPQALVGVEPGRNLYVNDTGHWLGRYVPAHIRRYPFQLVAQPADGAEHRYVIAIDEDAPHFGSGAPLFNEDGQAADTLKRVQTVLHTMQQDMLRTVQLVAQLDEAGVLEEKTITVNESADKPHRIGGFRFINAKALAELPDETLVKLMRSGALMLAYAHQVSLTNLKDGRLAQNPPSAFGNAENISFGGLNS